jgi:hypothetical protein
MAALVDDEALLSEMREAFKSREMDDDLMALDDATFRRYLRARKGDVIAAQKMLEESLAWRKDFEVSQLLTPSWIKTLEKETSTGKMYCRGYDRDGHPLLYMKPRYENTNEYDGNLKNLVYNLERCIKAGASVSQEKLVLLIDFAGYSTLNAPPMKTSKATLSILQNQYPERLHSAYICRAPWIFSAFWTMISPFIDPVTYAKIKFVNGTPEEIGTTLTSATGANIAPEVLEVDLGGADRTLYSGGVYLGLSKERPATLEKGAKLPHTVKEALPAFKSVLGEDVTKEELGSCKDAFAVTYRQLIEDCSKN